jgi:hypothetical protein
MGFDYDVCVAEHASEAAQVAHCHSTMHCANCAQIGCNMSVWGVP